MDLSHHSVMSMLWVTIRNVVPSRRFTSRIIEFANVRDRILARRSFEGHRPAWCYETIRSIAAPGLTVITGFCRRPADRQKNRACCHIVGSVDAYRNVSTGNGSGRFEHDLPESVLRIAAGIDVLEKLADEGARHGQRTIVVIANAHNFDVSTGLRVVQLEIARIEAVFDSQDDTLKLAHTGLGSFRGYRRRFASV